MKIYLTALTLLFTYGLVTQAPEPCAVRLNLLFHGYNGEQLIDNACLIAHEYGDGVVLIEARDMGDGIFRDGFDGDLP